MEDFLKELKSDVKEIKSDIRTMSQTLDRNTASLIVHEARTTLAEKRIEKFENGVRWLLGMIITGVIGTFVKSMLK